MLAGCAPSDGDAQVSQGDAPSSADAAVASAQAALRARLPWRATRILARVLADSAARSPEATLLGAEAAAAWQGWDQVRGLLEPAPWLDTGFGGRGHALLAQAALERRADSAALTHAERALAAGGDSTDLASRLVLLGRAQDRLDLLEAAARSYTAAAEREPDVGDWLLLRAAVVTPDSAARAALLARVTLPLARTRVAWTEAQARERASDWRGAQLAWEAVGERQRALAAQLSAAASDADSAGVRERLLTLIQDRSGRADAERAIGVMDLAFGTLRPAEELAVFRSTVRSGPRARAEAAFQRAATAGLVVANDRFLYAGLLERLGRYPEAAEEYGRVRAPSTLAPQAAYLRARALLRAGRLDASRTALRAVLRSWPQDTASAISLLLLADLAIDEGRDGDARTAYMRAAREFPRTRFGSLARYQGAVIAFALGRHDSAAAEFDSVHVRYPSSDEALGALYWSGRARAALGDSTGAQSRWSRLLEADPASYYGLLAAARLGVPGWAPTTEGSIPEPTADLESGLRRAERLEVLGLLPEAQAEYDALLVAADSSVERQLATAHGFLEHRKPWRSIQLGQRAVGRGAPRHAATLRLLYPLMLQEGIVTLSEEHELDPALVAGLIRQESTFNPSATSVAGARGLMQVMPEVGSRTARALGYPVWSPALLWQPDVNLELGIRHLAEMRDRHQNLARLLAAYNAGGTPVGRWETRLGASDPELYIERIPYRETRDYVRVVQRNRAVYRALYPDLRDTGPGEEKPSALP